MESESTGTKYMAANHEGSQSSPKAEELRKRKKKKYPCLEWDSNPPSQCSNGRRNYML
jgi:hypothetical protein